MAVTTPSKTFDVSGGKLLQSPLENYLEKQREKIRNIKNQEKKGVGTLQEYQLVIEKKDGMEFADGLIFGNCHQREGHNKLNGAFQRCETVFLCGDIAKHAEEKVRMKQVEKHPRQQLNLN